MRKPLAKLVGLRLSSVEVAEESLGLMFDGCVLRGFTKHQGSRPLMEFVGLEVSSAEVHPGVRLRLEFGPAGEVSISLAEADYVGPEAFCARFADGAMVVG